LQVAEEMPNRTARQCAEHYTGMQSQPAADLARFWTRANQLRFFEIKVQHCGKRFPNWGPIAEKMSAHLGTTINRADCQMKNKRMVKKLTAHGMSENATAQQQYEYLAANPEAIDTTDDILIRKLHAWAATEGFKISRNGETGAAPSGSAVPAARRGGEAASTGAAAGTAARTHSGVSGVAHETSQVVRGKAGHSELTRSSGAGEAIQGQPHDAAAPGGMLQSSVTSVVAPLQSAATGAASGAAAAGARCYLASAVQDRAMVRARRRARITLLRSKGQLQVSKRVAMVQRSAAAAEPCSSDEELPARKCKSGKAARKGSAIPKPGARRKAGARQAVIDSLCNGSDSEDVELKQVMAMSANVAPACSRAVEKVEAVLEGADAVVVQTSRSGRRRQSVKRFESSL
jgi:hypothetical protein